MVRWVTEFGRQPASDLTWGQGWLGRCGRLYMQAAHWPGQDSAAAASPVRPQDFHCEYPVISSEFLSHTQEGTVQGHLVSTLLDCPAPVSLRGNEERCFKGKNTLEPSLSNFQQSMQQVGILNSRLIPTPASCFVEFYFHPVPAETTHRTASPQGREGVQLCRSFWEVTSLPGGTPE